MSNPIGIFLFGLCLGLAIGGIFGFLFTEMHFVHRSNMERHARRMEELRERAGRLGLDA